MKITKIFKSIEFWLAVLLMLVVFYLIKQYTTPVYETTPIYADQRVGPEEAPVYWDQVVGPREKQITDTASEYVAAGAQRSWDYAKQIDYLTHAQTFGSGLAYAAQGIGKGVAYTAQGIGSGAKIVYDAGYKLLQPQPNYDLPAIGPN